MRIIDISQEVFSSEIYEGDPAPARKILASTEKGDLYNLTAFSMCAHNGTHIDAPYHFLKDGARVEQIALENTVGYAFVAEHQGFLSRADAAKILARAGKANPKAAKRILLKGDLTVLAEAAEVFASAHVLLLGNESQSVGPLDAPMAVHRALLGAGVVLLEGIRLANVSEGVYFLSATPLKLGGADGAPCRAILIESDDDDSLL